MSKRYYKDGNFYLFDKNPGNKKFKEELKKQVMSFLVTEGFYNNCLNSIDYDERDENRQWFIKGYQVACVQWFQWCKDFCKDFDPQMKKPNRAEKKEFKHITTLEDGTDYEWPLLGIIHYRGGKIPVYDDDCGQCYFCRLPNGEEVGGGAFNLNTEKDFCYAYDLYLQNLKKENI